jgi:hypothetical protein
MSDMLKSFVRQELERSIREEYPHLRYPFAMYAKIVDSWNEAGHYSYVIRILDKNKREDARFPEIPKVSSEMPYKVGDIVTVVFLYGNIVPYIMGRAV